MPNFDAAQWRAMRQEALARNAAAVSDSIETAAPEPVTEPAPTHEPIPDVEPETPETVDPEPMPEPVEVPDVPEEPEAIAEAIPEPGPIMCASCHTHQASVEYAEFQVCHVCYSRLAAPTVTVKRAHDLTNSEFHKSPPEMRQRIKQGMARYIAVMPNGGAVEWFADSLPKFTNRLTLLGYHYRLADGLPRL